MIHLPIPDSSTRSLRGRWRRSTQWRRPSSRGRTSRCTSRPAPPTASRSKTSSRFLSSLHAKNNRETLSTKQFHFQVNDLYENKNLYMVVDNLYNLGGMVSIKISNRLKTNICTMTPLIKRVIFIFKSKYLGVFTVHCSTFRPRRMVGTAQCWGWSRRQRTSASLTRRSSSASSPSL